MAYKGSDQHDIDITKDELNKIKDAFKNEEFRKLFKEYVDEVNDPENKALYEKELTQFEKERGIDVTFIHPSPGYVIKTSVNGSKKAFINICENEKIGKPSSVKAEKDGFLGSKWSIPYIHAAPRDDTDKNQELCLVYDVVFHPNTLELTKKDERLKNLVNDTALTAIEDSFKVTLDRKNLKFPRMGYKGYKHPCIIRKKCSPHTHSGEPQCSSVFDEINEKLCHNPYYPYNEPSSEESVVNPRTESYENPYTTPKYIIKQRKELELQEFTYNKDSKLHSLIPNELIIEVHLPLLRVASDVELDLDDKSISLKSETPAKYKLDAKLPYSVIESESSAKFDVSTKKLIISASVNRMKQPPLKDDSGVESDPSQSTRSSSDEDISSSSTKSDTLEKPEIGGALRVSSVELKEFLSKNVHYTLPLYNIDRFSDSVVVTLKVVNVEHDSVIYRCLTTGDGYQIKFCSIGPGHFPIHYAFCLKIPNVTVDKSSISAEVWDETVQVFVSLSNIENDIYYVGCDDSNFESKSFEDYNSPPYSPYCDDGNKKIFSKLKLVSMNEDDSDDEKEEDGTISEELTKAESVTSSPIDVEQSDVSSVSSDTSLKQKKRTSSESFITPIVLRSILKVSRSLSESHTDDYSVFSSFDSEPGTPQAKKHVRFCDTISKQFFRANSSILGQKKKNQRKSRNKKKSMERRLSESSGVSESECSEVSDYSEVSDVSETSESDDGSNAPPVSTPSSKNHRRRGKKNHRKTANTAKINYDNDH